jgi:hypothetical protein
VTFFFWSHRVIFFLWSHRVIFSVSTNWLLYWKLSLPIQSVLSGFLHQ